MGYLLQLLPEKHIAINLDVKSKRRVFDHAGLMFEKSLKIGRKHIFQAFLEREQMGSTALGNGVAIPHGRLEKLKKSTGAFIRIQDPIPFEAPDHKPVYMFFFLLVPAEANELHLQILSELAQLFSSAELHSLVSRSNDLAELCTVFSNWEEYA